MQGEAQGTWVILLLLTACPSPHHKMTGAHLLKVPQHLYASSFSCLLKYGNNCYMTSTIISSSHSQQVIWGPKWHFVVLYIFRQSMILLAIQKSYHRRDHYDILIKEVFILRKKRKIIANVKANFLENKTKK